MSSSIKLPAVSKQRSAKATNGENKEEKNLCILTKDSDYHILNPPETLILPHSNKIRRRITQGEDISSIYFERFHFPLLPIIQTDQFDMCELPKSEQKDEECRFLGSHPQSTSHRASKRGNKLVRFLFCLYYHRRNAFPLFSVTVSCNIEISHRSRRFGVFASLTERAPDVAFAGGMDTWHRRRGL